MLRSFARTPVGRFRLRLCRAALRGVGVRRCAPPAPPSPGPTPPGVCECVPFFGRPAERTRGLRFSQTQVSARSVVCHVSLLSKARYLPCEVVRVVLCLRRRGRAVGVVGRGRPRCILSISCMRIENPSRLHASSSSVAPGAGAGAEVGMTSGDASAAMCAVASLTTVPSAPRVKTTRVWVMGTQGWCTPSAHHSTSTALPSSCTPVTMQGW